MMEEIKPNSLYVAEIIRKQSNDIKTKSVQESVTKIDFVKTLENIHNYCDEVGKDDCGKCRFYNTKCFESCGILGLIGELFSVPCDWDIKRIKEILDE